MNAILGWLEGKKTYAVAIATILVAGLHAKGYIDEATTNTLYAVLGGAGLAALRAGVTKSKP